MRRRRESLDASRSGRSAMSHLHAGLNVCSVFHFSMGRGIQTALQTLTFQIVRNPTCACSRASAVLHSAARRTPRLVSSDGGLCTDFIRPWFPPRLPHISPSRLRRFPRVGISGNGQHHERVWEDLLQSQTSLPPLPT